MEVDEIIEKEEPWENLLIDIFNFIQYRRPFFDQAITMTGQNSFESYLYDYTFNFYSKKYKAYYQIKTLSSENKYILEFLSAGSVQLIRSWIKSNYQASPENMSALTFDLIPNNIKLIFNED